MTHDEPMPWMDDFAPCPDCDRGFVEREFVQAQGFTRDTGFIDVAHDPCPACGGTGWVPNNG